MSKLGALLITLMLISPAHAAQSSRPPSAQGATIAPAAPPAWEAAIAARRQELIAQNGPGTDAALRDRLLQMRDLDQTARGLKLSSSPSAASSQERLQHLTETDLQLTSELKSIIAEKGWPTITLVGIDASDAAMLLLTHTPDHAWQLFLIPQLEQLADSRKIDAAPLALVVDKESVAAGRPQRYGSQFKLVNGHMAMYAVEDPGNLDTIRARGMLPPMDVYKQLLARMYGLKVSNDIITAAPPARAGSGKP